MPIVRRWPVPCRVGGSALAAVRVHAKLAAGLRLVGLIVIILAFEIMAAGLTTLLPGLAGTGSGS